MITILSPAKSLDFTSKPATRVFTQPRLVAESSHLIDALRQLSVSEVAGLMRISDELAALNVQRYADFTTPFTRQNARQAILAFDGDVYQGLDAPATFTTRDYTEAQKTVRILSGLYGVLRPLDLMQPYRLEMGTRLENAKGSNLYQFWGTQIADYLNERSAAQAEHGDTQAERIVVNLASQEYFKAVDRKALKARVIDCVFEDWKAGAYKIISFHAKRARGLMARHAITHRIATPHQLEGFDLEGYAFAPAASEPERLVFRRKAA